MLDFLRAVEQSELITTLNVSFAVLCRSAASCGLFQVGGLSLVIAGAVLQLKYTGLLDILGDERLATPILLLCAGALCSLLGFLGCCGAIRENYCLTVSFAVLLALVLMIETAAAIAAYALHEPLQVNGATF